MAGQQGVRAGKAFVELYTKDSELVKGLRRAQRKLSAFGKQVTSLGASMARMASIAAAPIGLSLKIFSEFSDQMSKIKAVTAGTEKEFAKLNETAKELGRTTSFTASAVAAAMVELGRAGFSRKEIDVAIAGILDLSRATDTEVPEAAGIAGAALRQFGMEAEDMGRVVDVLTATANGSAQTLTDLGEALKPVGPIAAEAGESIEEVSAAIGVLANNGIKGSLAGNSLARAYKNLSDETKQNALRELGVEAVDAQGNLRPLATIIAELGTAVQDMGSAEKLAAFENLFGRGQAAALKLAGSGGVFDDLLAKLRDSQGLAAETAVEMDNNLGGAFRRLTSAAEGVAIAIGTQLTGSATGLIDKVSEILGSITAWISANGETIRSVTEVILKVGAAGVALVAFGKTITLLSVALGAVTSPITLVVAALTAIGAIAYKVNQETGIFSDLWEEIKTLFEEFKPTLIAVGEFLKDVLVEGLRLAADGAIALVKAIQTAIFAYEKLIETRNEFTGDGVKNIMGGGGAAAGARFAGKLSKGDDKKPDQSIGGLGGFAGMLLEEQAKKDLGRFAGSGKPKAGDKPVPVEIEEIKRPTGGGSNPIADFFRGADEKVKEGVLGDLGGRLVGLADATANALQGSRIQALSEGGTFSSNESQFASMFFGNKPEEKVTKGEDMIGRKLDKLLEAFDEFGVVS